MGDFQIQTVNRQNWALMQVFMFTWSDTQKLIVVTNFSWEKTSVFELKIPADVIRKWS
jgi:hypothetical protein